MRVRSRTAVIASVLSLVSCATTQRPAPVQEAPELPAGVVAEPTVAVASPKISLAERIAAACEGGNASSCYELGAMYDTGDGVERDAARGAALYRKACDRGVADACNDLGASYAEGEGVEKDLALARGLYENACVAKSGLGCKNLGDLYRGGNGVAKDQARAVASYLPGCALGEGSACYHGGLTDAGNAAQFFGDGCKLQDRSCCGSLARLYEVGQGVEKDVARAAMLFEQACALGDGAVCSGLAEKRLAAGDAAGAASLLERACNSGAERSCRDLAEMLASGRQVPRDDARAAALFFSSCERGAFIGCKRACDLGSDPGCKKVLLAGMVEGEDVCVIDFSKASKRRSAIARCKPR